MKPPKTCVPLSNADAKRTIARFGRSPRTPAVPLLPPDVDEATWLAARQPRVGASELAAVLGISPYASPFSLWWSKQEGWENERTDAMKIGHKLEAVIADLFAETRPDMLVCRSGAGLWQHPAEDWLVCTPDYLGAVSDVDTGWRDEATGLISGPPPGVHIEPVECKSDEGGKGWGKPGTDEVPTHHRVQVLVQCAILGAPRGHLVRLAGKRFSAYVIEYDDAARAEMQGWIAAGRSFVADLELGVTPDVDGHEATTAAIERLFPGYEEGTDAYVPEALVATYERWHDELADAKKAFASAQNAVRLAMHSAQYGKTNDGRTFVERRVYKRRGYEVASTTVDSLHRKK